MSGGLWETLCSKTLPSSDSQTEGRARLGFGFPLIITLNTAVSFSLPPFQLCHNSSMFATPSLPLFVCLPLTPHSFFSASDAYSADRAGVQRATERNTGNEQFEYSYHLFYNCWSYSLSCFVLWLLGRNTIFGALSTLTDVRGLLHCRLSKISERNADSLFTAFMKTQKAADIHINN